MKLGRRIQSFVERDDGAITVDWVVLVAVISMVGLIVMATLTTSTTNLGVKVADDLRKGETGAGANDNGSGAAQ